MHTYDFTISNYRFHLFKENTLVITGFFRDDNPDNRTVEIYLDDVLYAVEPRINKGIEIRQKYLPVKANISEELVFEIQLPIDWESKKALCVFSINTSKEIEEKTEVRALPISGLKKLQKSVAYNVENMSFEAGKLVLGGWVLGPDVSTVELCKGSKVIPCEVSRNYRRDIKATYEELNVDYEPGFKVQATVKSVRGLKLRFICDGKQSTYKIRKSGVKSGASLVDKVLYYMKSAGLKMTILKCLEKLSSMEMFSSVREGEEYQVWRRKYEVKAEELDAQREYKFEYEPKMSIVIPLYDTKPRFLKELIDSIQNQTYGNWELCLADGTGINSPLKAIVDAYSKEDTRIKYKILTENKGISENTNEAILMASGEYIVLADHDDIVPANALFECVKAINEDGTIDVIYSDEDKIDMDGKKYFEPHFKSDFNIDLLCSMNYICHLFVVKKDIIDKVGMLRPEFDGAQDHDFILRCCEVAQNIRHIPKILYHWRCHINSTAANPESKRYAFEAGRKAVEEHYRRVGIPATVEHAEFYGMFRTKYHWDEKPLISIIIPNKDHIDDLKKIMDSIDEKSTYRNYEFVVVENNSTEQETFAHYKEIEKRENVEVLYYDGDFNFSKINNFGVENAKGEYLLLLNNDTEIISPECLEEMLYICMREEVGIVGAKLCYDDDTIQHAGVVLGFGGIAGHTFIGSSRFDVGYANRIACVQDYTAVTAACMMTKRSIYEQVGGLTESFKVAYNDIDYCMKVRALDKLVVYTPYAELYHYESKSRGLEDTPEKVERYNSEVARFIDKWRKELQDGDPYYNCNLTLNKADFSLKE